MLWKGYAKNATQILCMESVGSSLFVIVKRLTLLVQFCHHNLQPRWCHVVSLVEPRLRLNHFVATLELHWVVYWVFDSSLHSRGTKVPIASNHNGGSSINNHRGNEVVDTEWTYRCSFEFCGWWSSRWIFYHCGSWHPWSSDLQYSGIRWNTSEECDSTHAAAIGKYVLWKTN